MISQVVVCTTDILAAVQAYIILGSADYYMHTIYIIIRNYGIVKLTESLQSLK